MRRVIAGVIAGLVLGTTGTAIGAVALKPYWSESGNAYTCQGTNTGMLCKSAGFRFGVTKDYVFMSKGYKSAKGPVFACPQWGTWAECFRG